MRPLLRHHHSGFLRRWATTGLLLLSLAPHPAPAADGKPREAWSRKTGLNAPEAIAADINLDRRLEIVVAGADNAVMALEAESGRVLWRKELDKKINLLSPVAGHFLLGSGGINVVVASSDGMLYVLDGGAGKLIGTYQTGISTLTIAPTVFPWPAEGAAPYQGRQEGILLYAPPGVRGENADGKLIGFLIQPRGQLDPVFEFKVEGLLNAPPAVGKTGLNAPEPHVAFVNDAGKVFVFSARKPAVSVHSILVASSGQCQRGLSLGNLNRDPAQELVIADKNGYLHALAVQGEELAPVWPGAEKQSILNEPVHCPVLIDVNNDGIDDILIPREDGFGLLSGADGKPLPQWSKGYLHDQSIESAPAVFRAADGAYAVFNDLLSVCLLNLRQESSAPVRANLGRSGKNATPVVAPFGDGEGAGAVVVNSIDGRASLIDLAIDFRPQAAPWFGRRGGPARTCGEPRDYQAFRLAQVEQLSAEMDATLKSAQALAAQGDWSGALAKVRAVLGSNPTHREARRLHLQYFVRVNIIALSSAALLALALLGWLAWLAYRHGRGLLEHRLALRALAAEDLERATDLLYGLCIRFPRNRAYVAELSEIYIRQKEFNAQSAAIFDRARLFFPGEDRYLKALATAFSSMPRHDEAAAMIYMEMARISKKPGPWFFLLGQTLQQLSRPREALEAFRQAMTHGREDPRLPQYLTDLYVQLGIHTPDVLPTLDLVQEQRKGDRAFLRTYCQACQEARRYDEQAQQMAALLLEQDPAAPAAHVILATSHLQSGRHKDAMLHAQNVLQVSPNDSIGLRLLGACYAAERRLDATAMQIFARALQTNPDAPEILLAVSHGYIQEDRQDDEACEIYKKALVHSPQDETILAQLARIAGRDGDDDLTIRAIEPLLALGRHTRELALQLANAYCRQGITEDKAEPIYREALMHQPDHATIQDNLAAIHLRKGRVDAEAAQVYEAVLARHPDRFDIGMALMRCHHALEMPEKALELGRRLAERQPDNTDLKKLMAMASEKADQMESAILAYEQVLAGNPADKEAICALSALYGRKRRSDNAAIEIHNRAIQLEPRKPDHYLSAARAYAHRQSYDHAIQVVRHMLAQAPTETATAITLLESLVEGAPKAHKLRVHLVEMLVFEGRLRDARAHLGELLKIDPAQGPAALALYEKILEKNPKDALSHMERGRLLLGMGREQDARTAMEQAHRYQPESDEIMRGLMELYQRLLEKRDSAEIRFQLGRLAMRADKHDLAISCFQATRKDFRWEAQSIRNLARCFMAKGMLDLALQELKKAPMEEDLKELLYELGQRYEAVHDIQGARETYKVIFASDITYKDVKGKLESLAEAGDRVQAERTNILASLSEAAKRRYELVQELGRGAMGIVYKARDNELEEFVALKILPDNMVKNAEAVRRFKQEARNARRLAHPHIVRIHDIGEEAGRKYISMEFVKGTDLKQKIRQTRNRRLGLAAALRYARQICEAMAYAHSTGIVHRDIKPANIMLTETDEIKVTDFGIAKLVESSQVQPESTAAGAIIGTPLYMSPEQVKGQQVDPRADIYSMGCVFYELCSGRPPFTEGDLAYQHLFVEPKPLKDVPEPFAQVVMKCLAKEKEQRWQSVKEILDELNRLPDMETKAD